MLGEDKHSLLSQRKEGRSLNSGNLMIFLRFFTSQVLLRVSWNLSLGVYISLSLMALVATLLLPYETRGRAMQVSRTADKSSSRL